MYLQILDVSAVISQLPTFHPSTDTVEIAGISALQCSKVEWNTTQGLKCFISELPNVSLAQIKRYRGLHSRYQDKGWGERTGHGLEKSLLNGYIFPSPTYTVEKQTVLN